MSSEHSLSCAVLVCADGILKQGLDKIISASIYQSVHASTKNLQSVGPEDICRLCCTVVSAQSVDIMNTMNSMLGRYGCDSSLLDTVDNNTVVDTNFDRFETEESKGRTQEFFHLTSLYAMHDEYYILCPLLLQIHMHYVYSCAISILQGTHRSSR